MRTRRVQFALLAILSLALLLAAHAVADYVEARRLARAIDASPAIFRIDPPRPAIDTAHDASAYYRAAGTLAAARAAAVGRLEQRLEAPASGGLDEALRAEAAALLNDSDAFHLLDRAMREPFVGFAPGAPARLFDLVALEHLVGTKALYAARTGDPTTAVSLTVQDLRLTASAGPLAMAEASWWTTDAAIVNRVQVLLEEARPGEPDLARLARALAEADHDDRLGAHIAAFLRMFFRLSIASLGPAPAGGGRYDEVGRVGVFGSNRLSLVERLDRPLRAARVAGHVEHFRDVAAALAQPWPARVDALAVAMDAAWRGDYRRTLTSAFSEIAAMRAARAAVAIERYRRAHGDSLPADLAVLVPTYLDVVPVDPFSGRALEFKTSGTGYAVYSVGPDRKDDGGAFSGLEFLGRPGLSGRSEIHPSTDVGVRLSR